MKKFLDSAIPVVFAIFTAAGIIGITLAICKCTNDQNEKARAANTYQYEITYVVYHPTEAKEHKQTGRCSYSNKYGRPQYVKRTRFAKNRLLVDFDEIYKGTDDFEVTGFTYHKMDNIK